MKFSYKNIYKYFLIIFFPLFISILLEYNICQNLNDTLKLSPKEITVLEIIKSNLTVTTAQIVEQTGFSRPTVMRAIKNLKENKILERVDSKKTGSWKVNV